MNFNTFFLLMAPAQQGTEGGNGGSTWTMPVMIVVLIVIFYFFMIRPQSKKQKKVQQYRESLKRGDKVVTIGGIHAKITDVQEDTFIIEVEDGSKLRIEKAAVAIDNAQVQRKDTEK
ncbi:MAG: preprotein translocase subunit YajC [Bacteroidales bacterium]|jgi:preprotein translocase subunit YajC|nr:preprotein translocase subunit YajC [Bacteroidales bacterium]